MNVYWLGRTLAKMGKKSKARQALQRAVSLPVVTAEDRSSVAKAKEDLGSL